MEDGTEMDPIAVSTVPVAGVRAARSAAFAPFLAYVAAFHLAWIAWPYVLYPRLTAGLGERTFSYALVQLTIRILFWILPVWVYLRHVDRVDPLDYLKLRQHVPTGLLVGLVLTALNLAGMVVRFGVPHPTMQRVTWNSMLGTSFLVGFIEEIPYRGFMLQKFTERCGFWTATLITSALFVAIHLPGWMALHTLSAGTVVFIYLFSVVAAIAFRVSDSLWAPILTHSANDFLSFVVFRL